MQKAKLLGNKVWAVPESEGMTTHQDTGPALDDTQRHKICQWTKIASATAQQSYQHRQDNNLPSKAGSKGQAQFLSSISKLSAGPPEITARPTDHCQSRPLAKTAPGCGR